MLAVDRSLVESKSKARKRCSCQLAVRLQEKRSVRRNEIPRVLILRCLVGVDLIVVAPTLRRTERRLILRCYIYLDTAVLDTDTQVLLLRRRTNRLVR